AVRVRGRDDGRHAAPAPPRSITGADRAHARSLAPGAPGGRARRCPRRPHPTRPVPMNAVERALRDFLAARPADVAVALVGGLAVSARAEPRFTRDLDFAIAVAGDDEAAHYVFRLRQLGYELVTALEQTKQHRLSTIRLRRGGR